MLLKDAFYPLVNLKQFVSLFFLVQQSNDDYDFVCESFNELFNTNYDYDSISLLVSKFITLFGFNKTELIDFFSCLEKMLMKKKKYLMPPVNKCFDCENSLDTQKKACKIVAYCLDSPKILYFKTKTCKRCEIEYSFRHYKRCISNETFLYQPSEISSFLATSQETCFEMKLLRYLDEQIIRNGVTFEGFCDSYNQLYPEFIEGRPLNRIRLAEAWYSFKIKHYLFNYMQNETFHDFKSDSTETYLETYINKWKDEFTLRWSKIHQMNCKVLNCDSTVILDGNHKNHRARCIASYEIDSSDLNDMCCKESPLQGSYFCLKHNKQNNIEKKEPNYDEDFTDIVGFEIIDGLTFYKFKYDTIPKLRLVSEKDIPVHLLTEFHKRRNLLNKNLVGSINSCSINKEFPCFNKTQTKGILTVSHGCGINLRLNELLISESRVSVINLLKEIIEITKEKYKYCMYDDGCHLDETVQANIDEHLILKDMVFLIDRFHIKNHSRKVCQTKYNPFLKTQLISVNSQTCEQTYSVLLKYKHMVKHMTKNHFNLFFLSVIDGLNQKALKRIKKENI